VVYGVAALLKTFMAVTPRTQDNRGASPLQVSLKPLPLQGGVFPAT
jgi:hypothetical protein